LAPKLSADKRNRLQSASEIGAQPTSGNFKLWDPLTALRMFPGLPKILDVEILQQKYGIKTINWPKEKKRKHAVAKRVH